MRLLRLNDRTFDMPDRRREFGRSLDRLMSVHEYEPGLIDSRRGEGGESRRLFVSVAVCVLRVLIITAAWEMLRGADG